MMKLCNGCVSLALTLAALAASVGATPALADDPMVTIGNFAFAPAELKVPVGTTVTFRNDDDTIHSIVAPDGSFRSKGLDTGDTFSFTFSKPGEFAYICGLHPFMHGKVTVTQ
jgi:plastocyanin